MIYVLVRCCHLPGLWFARWAALKENSEENFQVVSTIALITQYIIALPCQLFPYPISYYPTLSTIALMSNITLPCQLLPYPVIYFFILSVITLPCQLLP